MCAADTAAPLTDAEVLALFADLARLPGLLLAVSGGPDSTALLLLAARWRASLASGPDLFAATVDHGLRTEAKAEAAAVANLARRLGVPHRTLVWRGEKPQSGLQEAARAARYTLLASAARREGVSHIVTAHTQDDQAETVLFRLARGSGLVGLIGMMARAPVPVVDATDIFLLRPLLTVSKARLIATLENAHIPYVEDPTNGDSRFARARLRTLMPRLAEEGLTSARLALFARRIERAEEALTGIALDKIRDMSACWPPEGRVELAAGPFLALPQAIAERVMSMAIASIGHEEPIQLGKLEALVTALRAAGRSRRLRRTLAGDIVTLHGDVVLVERAPPRRRKAEPGRGETTGRSRSAAATSRLLRRITKK